MKLPDNLRVNGRRARLHLDDQTWTVETQWATARVDIDAAVRTGINDLAHEALGFEDCTNEPGKPVAGESFGDETLDPVKCRTFKVQTGAPQPTTSASVASSPWNVSGRAPGSWPVCRSCCTRMRHRCV